MARKKNASDEIGELLEGIIKAIVGSCNWLYKNIIWVMAVALFVEAILFFGMDNYAIIAIINIIILIFFGIRASAEFRKTR